MEDEKIVKEGKKDDLLLRIEQKYYKLSKGQKQLADYV